MNEEIEKIKKDYSESRRKLDEKYGNVECPQCGEIWNKNCDDHCPYCDYGQDDEEDTHPQMGER